MGEGFDEMISVKRIWTYLTEWKWGLWGDCYKPWDMTKDFWEGR